MKSSLTQSISRRGRVMYAAARQFGRAALGLPATKAATRSTIGDFTPVFWSGRRMTPDEVRNVIQQAVGGNIQQQWALFDMMEDSWPRLTKNLNELKRAAARATYSVQPYAERSEKPTDTAKDRADTVDAALRNWRPRPGTLEFSFEDALYNALDAYGKGISVLEVTWQRHAQGMLPRCAHLLHPTRYGWNGAGNELGLINQSESDRNETWSPFAPGQFWCGIWHSRSGVPGQTAMLRTLAPYWCGVTFGWEWLLNNAQIFGVPLRWATYDSNRSDLLPVLETMLANLGSAGWAAFPQGTEMEFKEAVQRASDNPQVLIQTYADKACDLLILGQEASSESKPAGIGNGASDLHGAVRADRLQDAAQWCADLLNYQLVPAVLRWNYGDDQAEAPTIVPDLAGEPDPAAKAERDVQLSTLAAMPKKWFYERHGIPEPEGDEEVVGGPSPAPEAFPSEDGNVSGLKAAPGGKNPLETATDPKNPKSTGRPQSRGGASEDPSSEVEARKSQSPESAVPLNATQNRTGSVRRGVLPGTYRMSDATRRALAAAQARDFEPVRKAAVPLFTAIEAGNLEVVGELEAFIAKLDELAPVMIGAGELADALEAALAEASIAGAAGSYGKISNDKTNETPS